MSRFLRTLVKVGLVELDPEDQAKLDAPDGAAPAPDRAPPGADIDAILADTEKLLASTGSRPAAPPPAPPRPPAAPAPRAAPPRPPAAAAAPPAAKAPPAVKAPAADAGLPTNRPLSEIYAEAGVPDSPFPAEKLARLLDGLRAMEPAMRRAAVQAMDAADDAWEISHPLQDAQRKVAALHRARAGLQSGVEAAEARAAAAIGKADAYEKEATDKIRAQIAELEALLKEELSQVAQQRANAGAELESARKAAAAEGARLDAEIDSLNSILVAFAPPSPSKG